MPEWYKKRMLQRPGQETQSITERPSETYQLELPDFRIPTVTNSEYSIMRGLENRKLRDLYNQAYNEYLEQHPVSIWSKIAHAASSGPMFPGDASFSNFAFDPTNITKENAYKYAVEKSGYGPQNPNDFWRTIDKMRDKIALDASIAANTLPVLITAANGTFGTIPKLAADLKFAYDGYKELTSPEGWTKTKNFWNEGRYGRAALSGLGDALDLGLVVGPAIKPAKGLLNKYGKETIDALKFNLNNKGIGFRMDYPWQVRSNLIPSGAAFSGADLPALQSINRRIYQSPSTSQLEMIPKAAYTSDFSGLEFPELTMYHFGLDGQRAIDTPKFRGILGGGGYDPKFNNWFNQTTQYKLSQNEVRHSNLEKLLKKFNGNEQAMWNWLNKNK